jgi:hypothetical protein
VATWRPPPSRGDERYRTEKGRDGRTLRQGAGQGADLRFCHDKGLAIGQPFSVLPPPDSRGLVAPRRIMARHAPVCFPELALFTINFDRRIGMGHGPLVVHTKAAKVTWQSGTLPITPQLCPWCDTCGLMCCSVKAVPVLLWHHQGAAVSFWAGPFHLIKLPGIKAVTSNRGLP